MLSVLITLVFFNIDLTASSLPSTDEVFDFLLKGRSSREAVARNFNNTAVRILQEGFQPEVHRVVSEDGYILLLTRIKREGPPVLLVHGLFAASDTWLMRGRKHDLAFILADKGFDVWLPDLRGNCFSRKHRSLNVTQRKFWDFSFHEMGVYDLPAYIKEVLKHSTHQKLVYIGHSLGTTVFAVMASLRPEFNKYIRTSILLSPNIFAVEDLKSNILKGVYTEKDFLLNLLYQAKMYELMPRNNFTQGLAKASCSKPFLAVCLNFVGDVYGENRKNLNLAKIAQYLSSSVSGGSTKTADHFTQIYTAEEFKQFDYGEKKNLQVYGGKKPPLYPLANVSVPVVIFYSENDHFLDEKSVQKLASSFPNFVYKEFIPKYSHIDYVIGLDAPKILYPKIIDIVSGKVLSVL